MNHEALRLAATPQPEQGMTRNEVIATLHVGRHNWGATDEDKTLTECQADALLANFDIVRKSK